MEIVHTCFDCGKKFKYWLDKSYPNSKLETIESIEEELQKSIFKNICNSCLQYITKNTEAVSETINISQQYANAIIRIKKDADVVTKAIFKGAQISDLDAEEAELQKELDNIQSEVDSSEQELSDLINSLNSINNEENKYISKYNDYEKKIYQLIKGFSLVESKIYSFNKDIKTFSCSNILNTWFKISFSDKYGMINCCHMGEVNSSNYDEINAGWGYIVFLTRILTLYYSFQSINYELYVHGNYSKVHNIVKRKTYELSCSDNSRPIDKFNDAMEHYLEFFNEFVTFLKTNNKVEFTKNDFSFKIENNCINDKSIIFDQSKSDEWVQCMKYLLTILKSLITQVLKNEDNNYKEIIDKANIINPTHQNRKK